MDDCCMSQVGKTTRLEVSPRDVHLWGAWECVDDGWIRIRLLRGDCSWRSQHLMAAPIMGHGISLEGMGWSQVGGCRHRLEPHVTSINH